jgi:hypothetical protein
MKLGKERAERWRLYLVGFGTWEPVNRFGMSWHILVMYTVTQPTPSVCKYGRTAKFKSNERSERGFNSNFLSTTPVFILVSFNFNLHSGDLLI